MPYVTLSVHCYSLLLLINVCNRDSLNSKMKKALINYLSVIIIYVSYQNVTNSMIHTKKLWPPT